ncbi:hypothetical protein H310_10552 [Aphanomyces invadans]|uniref:Guanylate cyclase domain-containing protein n=1 Tax=Aphanomyces invadans TaxID=157072 RepID=A0A024TR00_9STRA|nr:hypothetical protein H310_10552 [Aphanomyces invadans]ETV96399.1 hypothetical protein H310_10552 [Aphanomyces invadans]|eukprot:XP_008875191.1 hypothetical protein H310_10552 [Aphanomyces invadans]
MAGPDVEGTYGFPMYCVAYATFMLLAFVASATASWTLFKYTKLVSSCVCYAMLNFFAWEAVCTFFRMITLASMIHEFLLNTSAWMTLDENHDVGGFRLIGHEVDVETKQLQSPPYHIKIPLFIGDTALISGAFWMLVLVIELLRLVKTTVDRGARLEKVFVRYYTYINAILVMVYLAVSFAFPEANDPSFYSSRFRSFLVASSVAQSVVIVAVTLGVLYMNCTGQKLESVECRIVQKPLYIRLKLILLIYDVTAIPYFGVGWTLAVRPTSRETSLEFVPNWILITSNLLFFLSPVALALVLVANQRCVMSWCMVSEDVIQQIQANEAPTDFPVFVNTDIESSSALWGTLGNAMHDAQDIHDNLLRALLVPHRGYEITTAGDAFQLAFHNIPDAVAYCLDVQEQLLLQPWPPSLATCQMPGSATITTQPFLLKRPKLIFHGVRVRMGIHASTPAEGELVNQVHPVTGRTMYVGLSELIGREVSEIGCGGQIVVTAPIVRWLRANLTNNTPWAKAHPLVLRELGVYHIDDLSIDLGIAQLVPADLADRLPMFPPLDNVRSGYVRPPGTNYSLLISPHSECRDRPDVVDASQRLPARY